MTWLYSSFNLGLSVALIATPTDCAGVGKSLLSRRTIFLMVLGSPNAFGGLSVGVSAAGCGSADVDDFVYILALPIVQS
jgi:hypothetical protein